MGKFKLNLINIPPVNTPLRRQLLRFTTERFYQKEIENGIPFFSEKELLSIDNKYMDNGMTKKDLMTEIYKKGWPIKENTIKSYIQKGLIPRSLKRVKTNQGMISIYPTNMIRHLNFIRYCLFSEGESIETLLTFIKDVSYDDRTVLEHASFEIDEYKNNIGDCFNSLRSGISMINNEGLPWMNESIQKAFSHQKPKFEKYIKKYVEIEKSVEQLEEKISEFEKELKKNTTLTEDISLETWTALLKLLKAKEMVKLNQIKE